MTHAPRFPMSCPRPSARLFAAIASVSLAVAAPASAGINVFSPEQDVEFGRKAAAEVEQQMPLVRDSRVQRYVDDLGARLARHAPGPEFPYDFDVIDASDLNAFALPGGPIYINRGILEAARNEGEIAGVLAHEIAHVARRHGTEQASKAVVADAGWGLLGGLLGIDDEPIAQAAGGFGLQTLFLKYGREDESQADDIGVQILVDAGYNPADMIRFFELLDSQSTRRAPTFLSSHPDPGSRAEAIRTQAQSMGIPLTASQRSAELEQVQAILARLPDTRTSAELARSHSEGGATAEPTRESRRRPEATDRAERRRHPRQRGTVAERIEMPADTYSSYRHPSGLYQVMVPSNWSVHARSDHGATLGPASGVRRLDDGTIDVVHGLLLNHHAPVVASRGTFSRFDPRRSHEDATDALLDDLLRSSPYLSVIPESARRVRTSGGDALTVDLVGRSPRTGAREHVTLISHQLPDEHLVYGLFVSPESALAETRDALTQVVRSLRVVDARH